jgi:hypothetical protein
MRAPLAASVICVLISPFPGHDTDDIQVTLTRHPRNFMVSFLGTSCRSLFSADMAPT